MTNKQGLYENRALHTVVGEHLRQPLHAVELRLALHDLELLPEILRLDFLVYPFPAAAAVARQAVLLELLALLALQVLLQERQHLPVADVDNRHLDRAHVVGTAALVALPRLLQCLRMTPSTSTYGDLEVRIAAEINVPHRVAKGTEHRGNDEGIERIDKLRLLGVLLDAHVA